MQRYRESRADASRGSTQRDASDSCFGQKTQRADPPHFRAARRLFFSGLPTFSTSVGARGFEPPTPWSRTRCATRLRYAPNNGLGEWLALIGRTQSSGKRLELQYPLTNLLSLAEVEHG